MSAVLFKIWLSAVLPCFIFSGSTKENEPVIWYLHGVSCLILVLGFTAWVISLIWLIPI
jgi:hypothetical protein